MATIRVQILTKVSQRPGADGNMQLYSGVAINSESKISYIYCDERDINRVQRGANLAITGCRTAPRGDDTVTINIHESAQTFHTTAFEVNEEVITRFFNAPAVTVAEALGSPPRRRLSVQGVVTRMV